MVSIAVVGHAMSGKTHLCMMIAGLQDNSPHLYADTCSTSFLKVDVNRVPWHIWDTPSYEENSWIADNVVSEANIVIICHDGSRSHDPCHLIQRFGADRCMIALTRTYMAGNDLTWVIPYMRCTTSAGTLVPVINAFQSADALISAVCAHPLAKPKGLDAADVFA